MGTVNIKKWPNCVQIPPWHYRRPLWQWCWHYIVNGLSTVTHMGFLESCVSPLSNCEVCLIICLWPRWQPWSCVYRLGVGFIRCLLCHCYWCLLPLPEVFWRALSLSAAEASCLATSSFLAMVSVLASCQAESLVSISPLALLLYSS